MAALLLAMIFRLVLRYSPRRLLLRTWVVAWLAQFVASAVYAVGSAVTLAHLSSDPGILTELLTWSHLPGQFLFLAMVVVGSLEATGRRIHPRATFWVGFAAFTAGGLIALGDRTYVAGHPLLTDQVRLVLTPVLFFGTAQLVIAGATAERRRGMLSLASALMLYGTLTTFYLFADFLQGSQSLLGRVAATVRLSAGYGDALTLTLLGAAVMVLVVQDAFLEAAAARDEQVRDLVHSRRRLHDIIQAAGEAILTVDRDGRIDVVNQAAEQLFGFAAEAASGRNLREFLDESLAPLADSPQAGEGEPTVAPSSVVWSGVGEGCRVDGSRFPAEYTVASLGGPDRPGGVVVVRDLTQRLAAEAQRELSERRLAESEKVLAVSRVVSSVINELEQPITTVVDQSERLLKDAGPAGEPSGLRMISDQASRARHIIRDLLAFVRNGADRGGTVDLSAVVLAMVEGLTEDAAQRGVTFSTPVLQRVPLARASRASAEQVLRGLLDNAVEAAGDGGTVKVSVRAVDRQVEVVVEDSGSGVPEALSGRIFEPSFTTKPGGKATGLGLSLSARIATALGGSLRLENRAAHDIGARFVLSLPIAATGASSSPDT